MSKNPYTFIAQEHHKKMQFSADNKEVNQAAIDRIKAAKQPMVRTLKWTNHVHHLRSRITFA